MGIVWEENPLSRTRPHGALDVEMLTTGPNAHGYGRLGDGRGFAFRIRNRKAHLEIYRSDADGVEPAPEDIELVAQRPAGRVNLDGARSLTVLLRSLVAVAAPGQELPERTLRAFFGRLDSVMDGWADAVAEPVPAGRDRTLRGYLHRLFADAA
jgi:hypothetical protein